MRVSGVKINVEIVDNLRLQSKGLSNRKSLDENSGMLFVYNRSDMRNFWMKDMFFDLDVMWISGDKIVEIQENISFEQKNGNITRFKSNMPVNWFWK